jgi:hypothetical protein
VGQQRISFHTTAYLRELIMQSVYLLKADYVKNHKILLEFNTGLSGVVDLKDIIFKYKQAEPLHNENAFSKFYLDSWPTLAWDCGFDIAPETLYKKCKKSMITNFK